LQDRKTLGNEGFAPSITFLLITFFGAFFTTFSGYLKSAQNSGFFDTHIEYFKNFVLIIAL
jgi:hypothetical protein